MIVCVYIPLSSNCFNLVFCCFQLTKSKECDDCKVFATDAILATLMTCARSKYSWDIVAQRVGDHLFFDKRDDSQFGGLPLCYKCSLYCSVT